MRIYAKTLCLSIIATSVGVFAMPAKAETITNLKLVQPAVARVAQNDIATDPAPIAATPAPAAQGSAPAPHNQVHKVSHHKKHGKKKHRHLTHKASLTTQKHKHAAQLHKAKKETTTAAHGKSVQTHKAATKETRAITTKKIAPVSGVRVAKQQHAAPLPQNTPNAKEVAYQFCLGYDNCVPHRYESGNGKSAARVIRQGEDGQWEQVRLDPVVMSDLNKLAQNEPGSRIERPLTSQEKALIVDDQARMHARLVSDVRSGSPKKEQIKAMMRELNIQNVSDLNAYDPRLCKQDVAVQAATELSTGR